MFGLRKKKVEVQLTLEEREARIEAVVAEVNNALARASVAVGSLEISLKTKIATVEALKVEITQMSEENHRLINAIRVFGIPLCQGGNNRIIELLDGSAEAGDSPAGN